MRPNERPLTLANDLKQWCNQHNLLRSQLAQELQIPISVWGRISSGNGFVKPEIYAQIFERTGLESADPRTIPTRIRVTGGVRFEEKRAWTDEQLEAWKANQGKGETMTRNKYKSEWVLGEVQKLREFAKERKTSAHEYATKDLGIPVATWETISKGFLSRAEVFALLYAHTGLFDPRDIPDTVKQRGNQPPVRHSRKWSDEQLEQWLSEHNQYGIPERIVSSHPREPSEASAERATVQTESSLNTEEQPTVLATDVTENVSPEPANEEELPETHHELKEVYLNSENDVLDALGAAQLLGVNEATIQDEAVKGNLPGKKIGNEWRFSKSGLLQWLSSTPATGIAQLHPGDIVNYLLETSVKYLVTQTVAGLTDALHKPQHSTHDSSDSIQPNLNQIMEELKQLREQRGGNNTSPHTGSKRSTKASVQQLIEILDPYLKGTSQDRDRLVAELGYDLGQLRKLVNVLSQSPESREEAIGLQKKHGGLL